MPDDFPWLHRSDAIVLEKHRKDYCIKLYNDLVDALKTGDMANALQYADDLSLNLADYDRLVRLAGRRGIHVEPWDQRDAIDAVADLCVAHHPEN